MILSFYTTSSQAFGEEALHREEQGDDRDGHDCWSSHDYMRARAGIVEDGIDFDWHCEHVRVI